PQAGPVWACLVLVTLFLPLSWGLGARDEQPLAREGFVHFPLIQGDWVGREVSIDPEVLASLRLTDHFIADYRAPGVAEPVNFYVAFYGSQRKGASVHSPKSCIPGGGWEIQAFGQVSLPGVALAGGPLRVNRVLIQMGEQRQLVYYWFQQRGRSLTNEYLVKWYIFTDALFMNRTDGALVRVTTPVPDGGDIAGADQRLERFVDEVYPLLQRYVPD
ncbi:MAG: EpsI family protein, partial [Pseudomonadales bacterium]|nr:EpsI family protein [Pseudomonadales bacterium]